MIVSGFTPMHHQMSMGSSATLALTESVNLSGALLADFY